MGGNDSRYTAAFNTLLKSLPTAQRKIAATLGEYPGYEQDTPATNAALGAFNAVIGKRSNVPFDQLYNSAYTEALRAYMSATSMPYGGLSGP